MGLECSAPIHNSFPVGRRVFKPSNDRQGWGNIEFLEVELKHPGRGACSRACATWLIGWKTPEDAAKYANTSFSVDNSREPWKVQMRRAG